MSLGVRGGDGVASLSRVAWVNCLRFRTVRRSFVAAGIFRIPFGLPETVFLWAGRL